MIFPPRFRLLIPINTIHLVIAIATDSATALHLKQRIWFVIASVARQSIIPIASNNCTNAISGRRPRKRILKYVRKG